MQKLTYFLLACLGFAMGGCEDNSPTSKVGLETRFELLVGDKAVQMRIACTPEERQQGLMHVESMSEHEGMLFLARQPEPHGFWMKNTLIPLDIGYFTSDGVLREIHPMYRRNLDSVKSRRKDIRYALEMNQGWYRKNGIAPGAKLNLKAVADAIRARGHNPAAWID